MASTEPRYDQLAQAEQNLDSLARLLTGGETCAAICYFDNKLIVASNKESPEYAKEYLSFLGQYTNAPFKANYQLLVEAANKQITNILEGLRDSDKLTNGLKSAEKHKDIQYQYLTFSIIQKKDFTHIQQTAEGIIQNHDSTPQARELAVDILRPMIDTRIIINAIESHKHFDDEVVSAIKNNNVKYLSGSLAKHAEMKIFDEIFEKPGQYYIGISKLTCWPCDATLELSNKANTVIVKFSGTHGGTYLGWEAPSWIIDNSDIKKQFIQQIQEKAGKYFKIKETYPYLANSIPDEPILGKYKDAKAAKIELSNYWEYIYKKNKEIKQESEKFDLLRKIQDEVKQLFDKYKDELSNSTGVTQSVEYRIKQINGDLDTARRSLHEAMQNEAAFTEKLKSQQWEIIRVFLNSDPIGKEVLNEIRRLKFQANQEVEKISIAFEKYLSKLDVSGKQTKVDCLTQGLKSLKATQDKSSLADNIKVVQSKLQDLDQQVL